MNSIIEKIEVIIEMIIKVGINRKFHDNIDIIIKISLNRLIDGGAEILIIVNINHQNMILGNNINNPLKEIILRVWNLE